MHKLKFIIAVLLVFIGFVQGAQSALLTTDLLQEMQETELILKTAIQNDKEFAPYFKNILNVIPTVPYEVIDENHLRGYNCQTMDAFYIKTEHKVYICTDLLTQRKDFIAQKLIHEFAHATGILDECLATSLELFAMEAAARIPGPLSYQCGL